MDLSKLSKAQKLQLLDAIEEKKRRLREKRDVYAPNAGQEQVHRSPAQIRAVFSGNGAGKTGLSANEAIWWARGHNPLTQEFTQVPAKVVVLLDKPEKVSDLWLPELSKWTNITDDMLFKDGKPHYSRIRFKNGSEIKFMFHEQSPLSFESIELDYLICDEPPPRHAYIGLMRGTRKKHSNPRALLVGTPIAGTWMFNDLWVPWERGDLPNNQVECFKFHTKINKANLADGYIERMERILTDKEKASRLGGDFWQQDGLALAHLLDSDVHLIDFPPDWSPANPCVVIVDPHPSKAHTAVLMGVDRENHLYVLDEYSEKEVARSFTRSLITRGWFDRSNYGVIDVVVDSLGSADMTSGEGYRSFIEVMNEELQMATIGRARATSYRDKDDEDFIERIRDVLAIPEIPNNFGQYLPKLRIVRTCTNTWRDLENVQWLQHRKSAGIDENKPKLDIRFRDYLACVKYGLASNLYYNKTKAPIFVPKKGPQTYGVTSSPPQRGHVRRRPTWRRKLMLK